MNIKQTNDTNREAEASQTELLAIDGQESAIAHHLIDDQGITQAFAPGEEVPIAAIHEKTGQPCCR